jgi:hypothetical protein
MKNVLRKFNLVILLFFILPSVVLAVPQLPASFYGIVTINGRSAESGSVIVAEIDGLQKGSIVIDVTGKYGGLSAAEGKLHVFDGSSGDTILFYIQTPSMANRIQAKETAVFSSGSLGELDLSFIGDEIPKTNGGTGTSTGGGGTSTSGGTTPEEETTTIPVGQVESRVFEVDDKFDSSGVATLEMSIGDEAKFTFQNELHSVKVKSIGGNLAVLLTISSDPFDIIVNKDETKNIDLNKDGKNDLAITLNKILSNKIELKLEKLWTIQEANVGSGITGMVTAYPMNQIGVVMFIIIIGAIVGIYLFRRHQRTKNSFITGSEFVTIT